MEATNDENNVQSNSNTTLAFPCVYCCSRFMNKVQRKQHMKLNHAEFLTIRPNGNRKREFLYKCLYCSYRTADDPSHLLRHVASQHISLKEVTELKQHFGLENCPHGCGKTILKSDRNRHKPRCQKLKASSRIKIAQSFPEERKKIPEKTSFNSSFHR